MPLPQQVVEQLSRNPGKTPGWSSGVILFAVGIFGIAVLMYAGLAFGYEPYLNGQISSAQNQITALGQKVSPSDEARLIQYYSQIANVQQLIQNHVLFSGFLTWLGSRTDVNVYYTNLSFASGNQVTLAAIGKSQADVAAQVSVFESDPAVQSVSVSNIAMALGGGWSFNVVLAMDPAVFSWQVPATSTAATTTTP